MIVFDLECRVLGHRFEGWFSSSEDYASQQERGLVCCPQCGSLDVIKAPMAPNVGRKGNQLVPDRPADRPRAMHKPKGEVPPEVVQAMQALAKMQAEALKQSRWVGEKFVEESRAMHYGERELESIHGQATLDEAKALLEEGIEVAPILFPVAPPGKTN